MLLELLPSNGPKWAKEYASTQTKTARAGVPVDDQLDPKVISFRAQFDQRVHSTRLSVMEPGECYRPRSMPRWMRSSACTLIVPMSRADDGWSGMAACRGGKSSPVSEKGRESFRLGGHSVGDVLAVSSAMLLDQSMARPPRVDADGEIDHVLQRGTGRMTVLQ